MAERARPVGALIPDPSPAPRPSRTTLHGRSVRLEPLQESHAEPLYPQVGGEEHAWLWDYMGDGPFTSIDQFRISLAAKAKSEDPFFWAVIVLDDNTNNHNSNDDDDDVNGNDDDQWKGTKIAGYASLLRISPEQRTVEVGNLLFSPALQRTTAATETIYLLARYIFLDLGYRRLEWKCNNLNAPSKRAALRLGFTPEGVFRQHLIVKGRNRDTAWYAILDSEWDIGIQPALEKWLDPSNFDHQGRQLKRLEEIRFAAVRIG